MARVFHPHSAMIVPSSTPARMKSRAAVRRRSWMIRPTHPARWVARCHWCSSVVYPIAFVVIGTSLWVYFDARAIGVKKGQVTGLADLGPGGWLVASLLLWIIAFPLYLANRGKFKAANRKPS